MADLRRADLGAADLRRADLSGADLTEAHLNLANLSKANLGGADLADASFSEADFTEACLNEVSIRGANLTGANLISADLSGAWLEDTVFGNTNLTDTQGLDTCKHSGPSTLDFRTLARSGKLPLAFLRGCGLPEALITYLPSILNQPIQFYSCFISYSTRDQEFANSLHAYLQNKGVRCWFAPHDIQGGKKIHEQIDEAIRVYDRLLLILSEASMASNWVKTEIANARQKEVNQNRQVLFPVSLVPFPKVQEWKCFDADTGIDSAREIREYFIPDFSNWKDHNQYQKAFDQLIDGLKTDAQIPSLLQDKEQREGEEEDFISF